MTSLAEARQQGKDVPINPQELFAIINQFRKEAVTPPTDEEIKVRENQAKEVQKEEEKAGIPA